MAQRRTTAERMSIAVAAVIVIPAVLIGMWLFWLFVTSINNGS